MKDIFYINYQFLLMARDAAKSNSGEVVFGLSRAVLDKLSEMNVNQIDNLARSAGVSLLSTRLNESEMTRLIQMPETCRTNYIVSISSEKH